MFVMRVSCSDTQYPTASSDEKVQNAKDISHTITPTSTTPTPTSTSTATTSTSDKNNGNKQIEQFSDANVDAVITKYKRAASFLWTILHAQACRKREDQCPIQKCSETKRLLAHMQSCKAAGSSDRPCPTGYEGCHQARKLLDHWRQCRQVRSKQQHRVNGVMTNSNVSRHRQSHCLLCTLLSRHKPVLSVNMNSQQNRIIINNNDNNNKLFRPINLSRSLNTQSMPPPPPRPATATGSSVSWNDENICIRNKSQFPTRRRSNTQTILRRRSRAVSFDERKTCISSGNSRNDPTIELQLRANQSDGCEARRCDCGGN